MNEVLKKLEECEKQTRSLIGKGAIGQLEPIMRQWQQLLERGNCSGKDYMDYQYYSMVFYQINGALYENAGRLTYRQESYMKAWEAAEGFAEQLLKEDVYSLEERYWLMALNSSDFLRTAAAALGTADKKLGVQVGETAAAFGDWLWPVLNETSAKAAPVTHMNAFYLNLEMGNLSAALKHEEKAEEQYQTLAARTGNPRYICESQKVRMSALLQKYAQTKEGIREIEQCLENLKLFKENPMEGESSLTGETATYYLTGITLLGQFYYGNKRLKEAKDYYQRALALMEQSKSVLPPLMLLKVRANIFLEMGHMAETAEADRTQAGFYYSQAAGLAQEALRGGFDLETYQTAVLGLYGAVILKKDISPREAVLYGEQGLELLRQFEDISVPGWSRRDLERFRKKFEEAAEKKNGGFLSSLFGRKKQ